MVQVSLIFYSSQEPSLFRVSSHRPLDVLYTTHHHIHICSLLSGCLQAAPLINIHLLFGQFLLYSCFGYFCCFSNHSISIYMHTFAKIFTFVFYFLHNFYSPQSFVLYLYCKVGLNCDVTS